MQADKYLYVLLQPKPPKMIAKCKSAVTSGSAIDRVCIAGMGKARHGTAAGGPGTGELRQSVKVGKLNLVDLAGSERVLITGATGECSIEADPP